MTMISLVAIAAVLFVLAVAIRDVSPRAPHDAGCPLTSGGAPLLVCDLWEHAYYLDYRNLRRRYIESFWKMANWRFAERAFEAAQASPATLIAPASLGGKN